MKLTRLAVSIICLLFFNTCIYSQTLNNDNLSNVKIDNVSNDELKSYYQQALTSGLTEEQVYKVLLAKGLATEELEKLKIRVSGFGQPVAGSPSVNPKAAKSAERTANADASGVVPMEPFTRNPLIFGSELFSSTSTVFEPNLRIATPSNYIIGPDDEIVINVFGFSEQTYNLTVNPEGNIYIPNVGPIYVNGLSMEQASIKIKNKLASTIYRAINSGGTRVQITLGKIRSIRVTVIGEARKPGTYTVSSLTTLFNLLYLCGGPSEMGSFRNIELIRGNELKRKVDIYNFLTKGDLKDNLLLQELDVIRIPYYQTRVTLQGEVKRQGSFELQANETFNQLLNYAGGFTDNAYRASVNVVRMTDKEKKLLDVSSADFPAYQPVASDVITIGKLLDRFSNRVNIDGAVFRPGNFELVPGMSLKDLIEKAGGLKEDAYLQRGLISRENADRSPTNVSFNISDVVNGRQVITLHKDDNVVIGTVGEMKDNLTVSIEGQVHKPGAYTWRENLTIKDLIFLSGGFSESANLVNIQVSRRIKDAAVSQAQYRQALVIDADLKSGLSGENKDIQLQPFDIVMVRALPGYLQQRTVLVEGEVVNTGKYTLETSVDRLTDLVRHFGGFKGGADSSSITLRRVVKTGLSAEQKRDLFQRLLRINDDSLQNNSSLRNEIYKNFDVISVNLKQAIESPQSTANLLLEDGDYITVSRASTLVRVSGEVYYPTQIPYIAGSSMKYYLNRSGGFTESARKSSALVIYPDGRSKSIKRFLFFRSYPDVMPRSEIYVPAKNISNRKSMSTGEWIGISSIFVTLGSIIVNSLK